MPPRETWGFVLSPWPRYLQWSDVLLNVAAYLPLGAMLCAALRARLHPASACAAAALLATALSLALEGAQLFLPARIASNADVLANGAGAVIGALAAWAGALPALAASPLIKLRRHALRDSTLADCGAIVIALWLLTQFYPAPFAMGSGDLRELLGITPLYSHTPQSYFLTEACVVALSIAGIGLMVSLVLHPGRSLPFAIALTLLPAAAAKSIAAATLTRSVYWLQWLTPGMAAGSAVGIVVLTLLLRLSDHARAWGALCLIAAVVGFVNLAPENPYQSLPHFMTHAQPTQLITLSQMVRSLSQAWPFIAALFLIYSLHTAGARPENPSSN